MLATAAVSPHGQSAIRPGRALPTTARPASVNLAGWEADFNMRPRQVAEDLNYHWTSSGPPPDQSWSEAILGAYRAE